MRGFWSFNSSGYVLFSVYTFMCCVQMFSFLHTYSGLTMHNAFKQTTQKYKSLKNRTQKKLHVDAVNNEIQFTVGLF